MTLRTVQQVTCDIHGSRLVVSDILDANGQSQSGNAWYVLTMKDTRSEHAPSTLTVCAECLRRITCHRAP